MARSTLQTIVSSFGFVLVTVYVAWSVYIYFSPSLAADEIAYFIWANESMRGVESHGIFEPLFRTNLTGYGSTYWTIYVNLIHFLGRDAVWAMRSLAFLATVSIPIALIIAGNGIRKPFGWIMACLWISMPAAWWAGKISGPEPICMALVTYAALLLSYDSNTATSSVGYGKKMWGAWFLLGLSVSLKPTMVSACVYAFIISLPIPDRWSLDSLSRYPKLIAASAVSALLGFVLGSPIALFHTSEFIRQLALLPSGTPWHWDSMILALSNNQWAWDGVFSGGLVQWSCTPLVLVLLAAVAAFASVRVLIATAITFLATWLIIASKGALLGWYWFGLIPIFAVGSYRVLQCQQRATSIAYAILSIALINGVGQLQTITTQIDSKRQQNNAIAALPSLNREITELTRDKKFDLILDHAEVTYRDSLQFNFQVNADIIRTSPRAVWLLSANWDQESMKATEDDLARAKRGILSDVFSMLLKLGEEGTNGKSIFIVLSKRLSVSQPFSQFHEYVNNSIVAKSPPGTVAVCLRDLPHTLVYEIRTPNSHSKSISIKTREQPSIEEVHSSPTRTALTQIH